MAKFLVPALLKQLTSIAVGEAVQEIKLVVGVDEEVRKLEDNLRMIQAVLEDAEKRQMTEAAVKLWLGKLKDTFYLMDDVLDEWNTELIKAGIQEEEKEEENAESSHARKKRKVSFSMIPSPSSWFRPVRKLSMRDDFAHKIKDLSGKLDELFKERVGFGFRLDGGTTVIERPTTTSLVDVSKICGRGKEREELVSNLLGKDSQEEKSPHVISLIGMGGMGKTTLAQLAYNDVDVQAHFETRIWVCVSDPFDQIRIAKAIIESIDGQSPKITELQNLVIRICDLIRGKKFFLVLDDVWSEKPNDWGPFELALRCGAQGSRILITTRKEGVAKMVNSAYTMNLEVLSNEDSWLICSQMASVDKDDEQLGKLGRELANKCKGLPLAAKILGSVMGSQRSRQKWKTILDSNLWELEDVQNGVLGPLLFSYNELPSAIKQCFLYCASFPKDYLFSRNELVYQWMAQGYLGPNSNMEDTGEKYFEKLVMRSFFQDFVKDDNDDDKIIRCKMHDMVHDFALSMTINECFTIDVDKVLRIDWKSARHLTLKLYWKTQFPVSIYNAKNLRTLFLQTPFGRSSMVFSSDLFQRLTCLRSLSLQGSSLEKLPNEVEKLKHLRLLNLSNSNITELPETLCNLCNLQTLDISYCRGIEKLPQGMGKLIKLRHLLIDECEGLTEPFPKGIGRLSSLKTLNRFIIGGLNNFGECKLGELKNLVHLKGSLEIGGLENVTDVQEAENAQLKNKIHLRKLRLEFGWPAENRRGENDELVLNALEPHPELESLEIHDYGGTGYPNWVKSLTNLKKLELGYCNKLEQLPPLGKLRFLESLSIWSFDSVKKVGVEFLGIESNRKKDEEMGSTSTSTSSLILFPNLKSLEFNGMKEWEEWDGMGESGVSESVLIMPRLQDLSIDSCPKLKSLPNWVMSLTNLEKLGLGRCNKLEQLPPLGKLRFLESLRIWELDSVKQVGVEFLGIESNRKKDEEKGSTSTSSLILFPNLKSLEFHFMKECEEWDGMGESGVSESVLIMPRLQVLDIQECPELKALPNWVKSLTNLKELVLGDCNKLEQLPPLGKLRFLESLRIWELDSVKQVGVEFLGIESNRKKDEEKGSTSTSTSSLILFPNLKSLKLINMKEWEEWDGMGESGVSESVLIMPRLQFLSIYSCPELNSLPNFLEKTSLEELRVDCGISNWMTLAYNLAGLKTLRLDLNNNVEHLPPLGKLLLLESLVIFKDHRVKKVGVEFLGIEEESNNNKKGSTSSSSSSSLVLFPKLKSLTFWRLKEWEEWDGIGGTMREEEAQESGVTITIMPRLQELQIWFCPKLKSLPDFLPTTPLKTLKINCSPILSECCKTEIGDQWPKISHIPHISNG